MIQILWRGQEKIMADAASPEEWDKGAGIRVLDAMQFVPEYFVGEPFLFMHAHI